MKTRLPLRVVLATGMAVLLARHAFAATFSWTGLTPGTDTNPTSGTFNAGDAWLGEAVPTFDSAADIVFNYTGAGTTAITATNDIGVIALNSIAATNSKATITITGGTLNFQQDSGTLENPTITQAAASTQVLGINSLITLGANLTMQNNGTGQIQVGNSGTANAGNMDLGNFTLTLLNTAGASAYQFGQNGGNNRGVITGTGNIVQTLANNTATAAYFGLSTFSGGYTLNSGDLVIGVNSTGTAGAVTSGSIGIGTLTINGGIMRATSNGNRSFLNDVTLAGNFSLGDTTTTGLTYGGNMTLTGNRTVTVTGGGTAADLSGRHTFSGVIGDGGNAFGWTKSGAGVLVVSGANTYTGTTNVINGSLVVTGNVAVGTPSAVGNAASAVSLGGAGSAAANTIGLLVGVPGATPGAATITFARDITVGNVNSTGSTQIGTFTDTDAVFSGNIALSKSIQLQSVSTGSRALNITGTISGNFSVVKSAAGQLRMLGTNTYTGVTTIRTGTLLVPANVAVATSGPLGNASSAIALADGTSAATDNIMLAIEGALTIGRDVTVNTNNSTGVSTLTALNGTGTTANYGGTITLNRTTVFANATAGATTRFTGVITDGAGTVGPTINGPGIVEFANTAAHTFNGAATVPSGTLKLNATPGLGNGGGAIVGDGNTGTADLVLNGGTLLWAGNHQIDDGVVLQMSGGTLDLAGFTETIRDLDYTGGAIFNAGGLTITNGTDLFLFDGTTVSAPTVAGRKVLYAGSTTRGTISGALQLDNDLAHEFAVNDGADAVDLDVTGGISNQTTATTIIKRGGGTLRLAGAGPNTFGGAGQTVTIEGGILAITNEAQLGDAANTITFTGGALRFDGVGVTARPMNLTAAGGGIHVILGDTRTLAIAGQLLGSAGVFTKSGPGTLEIIADQSATWTGGSVALAGGALRITAENQLGAAGNDVNFQGGTLEVATTFTPDPGKVFTMGTGGGGLMIPSSQTFVLGTAGQFTGTSVLTKTGNGTLRLTAANATLTATAGVNVAGGTVELTLAQALGDTVKANANLSGGTLRLMNDAAAAFNNPMTVTGSGTVVSDVATAGIAAVTHTLGALSLAGGTLTANTGTNALGTGGITFGAATLTGNSTVVAGTANLTTGAVALGANTLTVGGAFNTQIAATSGGPGAGGTALIKEGTGTLVLPNTSTFTGNVVVNAGVLRANVVGAFGNSGNIVKIHGGTVGMAVTAIPYALEFSGGTLASTNINNATWNGLAGPTPSITFTTDTVFNLWDPLAPATDVDVNLGTGTTGVPTSIGPVNITVNANATNTNFATQRKLRFSNTTDSGSVTGTLTVNQNAVAQIRSGGATNALGAGVLVKLNTGINVGTPQNAGRLEFVAETNATYGTNVELLADSTIGVGRITAASNMLQTANNLSLGEFTLAVVDTTAAGSGYNLAFAGTTTLTGNPTFLTARNLTLANITDGAGSFGLTKSGAGTLTVNGSYDGPTTVNAGTLALSGGNFPGAVAVNAGTLALGTSTATIGTLSITGAGTTTSAAGSQLTTAGININSTASPTINAVLAGTGGLIKDGTGALTLGAVNTFTGDITLTNGTINLSVDNALPDTANVIVNGGTFNFFSGTNNSRSDTIASFTLNNGVVRTVNGTVATASLVTIPGTLTIAGGDLAINSGASISANKVIFSGGVNIHVLGGNTPVQVNELIVGPGGLEFTGANLRMNLGSVAGALGCRVVLNGNVSSFASGTEAGIYGQSAAATLGVREIAIGSGTRTFTTEDGLALNDLRMDYALVGSGSLVKAGPGQLLLSAINTYAGPTQVNGGTLVLGPGASIASTVVTVAAGATFDVSGQFSGFTVPAGGGLQVDGTLFGGATISGILSGSGTVTGNVTVQTAGELAPGVMNLGSTLTFFDDSAFGVSLAGPSPGAGLGAYNQLNLTSAGGSVLFGNNVALHAAVLGGFTPGPGQAFYILTHADAADIGLPTFAGAGEGATIDLGGGYTGRITYLADWTGSQGTSTLTGGNDVAIYNVVPEPGSAVLLLGGLGLLVSRRRRSK
jgi:autotransporter-associated beta strand protein